MSPFLSTGSLVNFFPRTRSLFSAVPNWLEKLLFVLICWQFAGLFWVLLAPATPNVKLVMPQQSPANNRVSAEAFLRWYGSDTVAEKAQDYSLIAVIAGANGAAVLKSGDQGSMAIRVGEEIAPGARLIAVEPEQITVERSGVRQVIKLPQKASQALFANVAPAQKTLPLIKMARGQMAGILQGGNLATWDKGLSSVADGGIRVDDAMAQPLAKMLRLKNGDILKSINGRRLDQVADSSLFFHFFGQQSAVDVVVVRDGATLTQHYDIQP